MRHGAPLAVALLGLLLGWLPVVGLAVSAGALGFWTWSRHRGRRATALGLALATFGILLGGLFTGLFFLLPVSSDSAAHQVRWLSFDSRFSPIPTDGEMP